MSGNKKNANDSGKVRGKSVLLRHRKIVELVKSLGFVSIESLSRNFSVSPQTIRRDINELTERGQLSRHHGGAGLPSSVENVAYTTRKVMCLPEKRRIARLLARHIPDYASLFIDIGTTTEEVANALIHHKGLRIITNILNVATILSENENFEVIVAGWIKSTRALAERISSTRIRELVSEGRMEQAEKMLGRNYQIRGKVVTGRDRGGKLLGIPTANINLHDELCPKTGIYAVTVECEGKQHKGVANIGYSPTFEDHEFTVEVHILDFSDNIYDKKIRVNFIKRIRDEIKFSNISDLIDQIKRDIAAAREIFAK